MDLIVAGGPTHALSMSRTTTRSDAVSKGATEGESEFGLWEWLAGLPSGQHAEKIATFDTKVDTMRHLPGSAAKGAAKVAHRHGYDSMARAESFMWTMLKVRCWRENSTAPGNGGVSSPGPWLTSHS